MSGRVDQRDALVRQLRKVQDCDFYAHGAPACGECQKCLRARAEKWRAIAGQLAEALRSLQPYAESRIEDIADCEDDSVHPDEHRRALGKARAAWDAGADALTAYDAAKEPR